MPFKRIPGCIWHTQDMLHRFKHISAMLYIGTYVVVIKPKMSLYSIHIYNTSQGSKTHKLRIYVCKCVAVLPVHAPLLQCNQLW